MATAPVFANTPVIGCVAISTANANRDGTGTIGSALTGSANGTKINEVRIKASGTTTAGMVRLYIYNGTTNFLFLEQTIAAVTPSASVAAEEYVHTFDNLVLPATYQLRASTHNAEGFNILAVGADI